jgi:hypothetical protein
VAEALLDEESVPGCEVVEPERGWSFNDFDLLGESIECGVPAELEELERRSELPVRVVSVVSVTESERECASWADVTSISLRVTG